MFYFVGTSSGKTLFFKESFLKKIEKIRLSIYGDQGGEVTFLEGKPIFTLLTTLDKKIVRLEFFERDSIALTFDDTVNVGAVSKLPNLIEFLKKGFSLPEENIKSMIEQLRKNRSRQRPQVGRSNVSA